MKSNTFDIASIRSFFMPFLFCHISWMREYRGRNRLDGEFDQPERGGRWVEVNRTAGECCNFLPDKEGVIYGHVETKSGDKDTQIRIENLGANCQDKFIEGIDVIWTATHKNGGKRVVGWYQNATVFRHRQFHNGSYPTKQHEEDGTGSYRITTAYKNAYCLVEDKRNLILGSGRHLPGQRPIFYPENHLNNNKQLVIFLAQLTKLINSNAVETEGNQLQFTPEFTGSMTYYVDAERNMQRTHGEIVNALYISLSKKYGNENVYNNKLIDIGVNINENMQIYEVKTKNDRQSIYTGIGQLIFYSNANPDFKKFLVLPKTPDGYNDLSNILRNVNITILTYRKKRSGEITFTLISQA